MRHAIGFCLILTALGCATEEQTTAATALTDKDIEAEAMKGSVILNAIFRFQNEFGLWPTNEMELIPEHLAKRDSGDWAYKTSHDGNWTLTSHRYLPLGLLRFVQPHGQTGRWTFYSGSTSSDVNCKYIHEILPKPTDQFRKKMHTLSARIASYPKQIVHQKGQVSIYFKMKQFEKAHQACLSCLERWPGHWWPTLMLGLIEIEWHKRICAEQKLIVNANQNEDFHHYYFLAHFYFKAGETDNALSALRSAVRSKLRYRDHWNKYDADDTGEVVGISHERILQDAAMLAFRMGEVGVCQSVCDRWAHLVENEKGYGDPGYRIIRAACYLCQSKLEEAKNELNRSRLGPNYISCSGPHVERLRIAIQSKNTNFHYIPDVEIPMELTVMYR